MSVDYDDMIDAILTVDTYVRNPNNNFAISGINGTVISTVDGMQLPCKRFCKRFERYRDLVSSIF
jgi:hypothetical protein